MVNFVANSEKVDFFISKFTIVEYIFFNTHMLKFNFFGVAISYLKESWRLETLPTTVDK